MSDNYPDGVHGADPRAPWNATDPWEGRECGTCRWLAAVGERHACLWEACNEGFPSIEERHPRDAACESWESWIASA